MTRLERKILCLAGGVAALVMCSACAPTIRAIPENVIENEKLKVIKAEAREEGRKEAAAVYKAQFEEVMNKFIRSYKDELLYNQMVKGGILKPGQVSMTYVPGQVNPDGNVFSSPRLEWKILSPPQFIPDEASAWSGRDRANFCYFWITSAPSETDALQLVGKIEKPENVLISSTPYGDGTGRWAILGKAPKAECAGAVSFFKARSLDLIVIE